MRFLNGTIAGVVAGLIGAAIWAGIAYAINVESGWVALGIGALVGFAAYRFGHEGGAISAVIAVAITILSICGGKYAALHFELNDYLAEEGVQASLDPGNEEIFISYVADDVVVEFGEQGKRVAWPGGAAPDYPEAESDYPADVWAVANTRWTQMSGDEQQAFKDQTIADYEAHLAAYRSEVMNEAFKASFGFLDIVFFLLAIATAFKLAYAGGEG